MTIETKLRCLRCSGVILRIEEDDHAPPWQWSVIHVCRDCGEHHVHDAGKLALRNYPHGPVVDISDEEARAKLSRGGCQQICGRELPWKVE